MDENTPQKRCVSRAVTVGICGAIVLLLLVGTSPAPVEGLRCRTGEGPSADDVKRIVRTCINKITNAGGGNFSSSSSSSTIERDRACLMQCFFEEMKATNADGFPEKHKVLHVITKDIREHELREFYVDSIQECFHMLGLDNRLKDKCDYSMRFVTCLSDRFETNCDDWESVTSAMF
uniref:Odorant binding protein Obp29 n=1 Tax=Anopheles coluzzii TaxID=1518534 RepID=A0A8F5SN70_ANOCL|nr:odorant binding protein Obp29 [Anopheles coluzzii]